MNRNVQSKPGEIRCPRCWGSDLVPSLPRGLLDLLMEQFERIPRHCRACGKRFYVRENDLAKIREL